MPANYKQLAKLMDETGISAYKICQDTGLSSSMFTFWKQGKSTPKQNKIKIVADYFGVPISYFYDDIDYALGITEEQAQSLGLDTQALKHQLNTQLLDEQTLTFAKEYQKLNNVQKAAIDAVINGFLQSDK